MLLLLLISSVVSNIPDEFACLAGPMVYGLDCKASLASEGWKTASISYTITEITTSDTKVECMGWGISDVVNCDKTSMGWYTVGLLDEGNSSYIFWGDNADYPAIKCKGSPFATTIKCCGKVKYDLMEQRCCGEKVYDRQINSDKYCCSGSLVYPAECCEIKDNGGHVIKEIPCPLFHCCQRNGGTFETVCCNHECPDDTLPDPYYCEQPTHYMKNTSYP